MGEMAGRDGLQTILIATGCRFGSSNSKSRTGSGRTSNIVENPAYKLLDKSSLPANKGPLTKYVSLAVPICRSLKFSTHLTFFREDLAKQSKWHRLCA